MFDLTKLRDEHTELLLMGVSTGLAFAGLGLAMFFWLRNRDAAAGMARTLAPLHTLLLNKYYVDELYDAVVVRPIAGGSERLLWRVLDIGVIDGMVNGTARLVALAALSLRKLQSGNAQNYAYAFLVGIILVLSVIIYSVKL